MNDIVLFGIISLTIIRLLALVGSVDFYFVTKDIKLAYFSIGWGFQIIGGSCLIISSLLEHVILSHFFLFLNSVFIALGAFIIVATVLKYFMTIREHFAIIMMSVITSISTLLYILHQEPTVSMRFTSVVMSFLILIYTITPFFKLEAFKIALGKSMRWFLVFIVLLLGYAPLTAFNSSQGYEFGLSDSNNNFIIILNYGYSILITSVQLVFIIHIEFIQRMNQNIDLKDKYSHELGNILQTIYTSIQLVNKTDVLDKEKSMLLDLSEDKCLSAAKFLKNIKKL